MSQINKICVIGAGVMGAGIAAQIANSKTDVILLDIIPGAAASAKEKMLLGKMPQIAHPSVLPYITPGDLDESLELIRSCDWVIEVIIEKLEAKEALYKKITPYLKPDAVLSSNTSTLPLKTLRQNIQNTFLLTHFFNPPRQMQLVELISVEQNAQHISDFITNKLGKTIVKSNDTPGFIANRIGCFLLELCLKTAYEQKLSIVQIDSYFTKEMGLPNTGIFGLFDLIGLDVMQMISNVLATSLDKNDAFCKIYQKYEWYDKMLSDGYKGRKALGGFYRMRETDGKKIKEVLDFESMEYVDATAIKQKTPMASITNITRQFFDYVNSLLNVVSSSKEDIDLAIKLGYSWKKGPFEMMGDITHKAQPTNRRYILQNPSAYFYQEKPGTFIFTLQTKMNTLDENAFNLLIGSIDYAEKHNAEKLIIYNDGKNFSAGANLNLFIKSEPQAIDRLLALGQKAMMRTKYSTVPIIACAKGVALGGGCELLLHAHKIFAHLDLAAGLVEVGIGLIPGWGGLKEMMIRANDSEELTRNLHNIIAQNKSSSAFWFASDYMIADLTIVMHEGQLLDKAIEWDCSSFTPNPPSNFNSHIKIDLLSACGDLKLDNHTIFIAKELQDVINSYSLSEEQILEFERKIFKKLLAKPETLQKIKKML